ncbi:MAG: CvpA family protein, partial [Lachnospiraceae bacterium]|nr:CvpA family protein [Lachnospiraceae bacterium]
TKNKNVYILEQDGYKLYLKNYQYMILAIASIYIPLNKPLTKDLIKDSPVEKWVYEKVDGYVDESLDKVLEDSPVSGIGKKDQTKVIKKLSLPENIKTDMIKLNNEKGYKKLEVDNFSDYITAFVTDKVVDALVFVVLFIVVSILVYLAIFLLDIFAKLPIIRVFNKGGGAVLGFVEGVLAIWIVCIIITMFGTADWGQTLFKEINNNPILDMIYSNNYLQKIINMI